MVLYSRDDSFFSRQIMGEGYRGDMLNMDGWTVGKNGQFYCYETRNFFNMTNDRLKKWDADERARASWITPRLLGGSFPTGGHGRTRLGVAGPDVVISVCAMYCRIWIDQTLVRRETNPYRRQTDFLRAGIFKSHLYRRGLFDGTSSIRGVHSSSGGSSFFFHFLSGI